MPGKDPDYVIVRRHPPERGFGYALYGGACCTTCCCCCCCCGHSVGSLAGAVVGTAVSNSRAGASSVRSLRYWPILGVVVASVLIAGWGIAGALIVVVALPLLQLLSSLIVAVAIARNSPQEERRELWRSWAWVTGLGLVGTLLGGGITWLIIKT